MEKISHTELEKSKLFLDLSTPLLNKIDLYFSNTDLSAKQRKDLIKILEEIYSEGYGNCLTD